MFHTFSYSFVIKLQICLLKLYTKGVKKKTSCQFPQLQVDCNQRGFYTYFFVEDILHFYKAKDISTIMFLR